ncbi:MAG: ATP-binding protein, partial [Gammaproteobacteria bacterium]
LMAELTLGLALLVVAWVAVYALVRRLSLQVDRRMQVERDLREAKELAEAHSKAKSEFLANMSHEIRTPMNAIIGMAYLLGRTPLDARQAGYLDNLRTSSEVLLQLVNDVLDFSKVEAGKLVLEREVFRVEDVLLRLSAIAGPRAAEKGIELIVRQDVEVPPTLVGDVLRLAQILLNLVNNAIKFTEAGEIVVSVQRRSIDDGVAELLFSVRDTGIGIDPQRLQGLFEPFVRADGSITRRYGGTGLGLSICRRLAEAMGGRIGAESTPGAGSRFWFTVRMGAVYMADQAARAVPDDLRALHVLVIDENSTSRVHCVDLLHQFGFKARAVASAAAAIASVQQADREQPYQLVILDRKLTDADSLVLAHKLKRELPLRKPPRVLLMADFAADAPDAQARTLLDGIIVKPLTRSTMLEGVMDAFGHGMARAGAERPAISKRPAAGLRVLVAEDNSINQAVVAELLREVQCELTLTANGLEALQALESSSFDLVLMDVQMPELDGLEATRRIRAQPALAELPVIAMTAH